MTNGDISKRTVIAILGLATAGTLLLFCGHFYLLGFGVYGDGLGYFAPLRSVSFDHDLVVSNEYERFAVTYSRFGGGSRWTHAIPRYSKYTVGMELVLSPFYALGHVAARLLNAANVSQTAPDGLSWPYELAYCLGSLLLGVAGLFYTYKACRLYFDRASSLAATLGVWFASPIFFYLAIETSMSHAVAEGLVSAFLFYCLLRYWDGRWKHALALGLLLGLAVLVRPQELLFASVPAVMVLGRLRAGKWRSTIIALGTIVFAVAALALVQGAVYFIQYGTLLGSPYFIEGQKGAGGASFNWSAPKLFQVLLSGYRGLFVWHPLTLLGVAGLAVFILRHDKTAGISLAAGLMLQIYLVAAWHCWWQGASVGSRMLSNCTLIFGLGLAALWSRFRGRLRFVPVLLTLLFAAWNTGIIAQYMSGMIPAERPVSAATLFANQSQVIPFFWRHIHRRKDTKPQPCPPPPSNAPAEHSPGEE